MAERALPHDLDAERSVLGALLVESSHFETVAELVQPKHFFRESHRHVFVALTALRERGQPFDFVVVKDELRAMGVLDACGGPAWVAGLADGVPRSTNAKYYAGIVREKALLRAVAEVGHRLDERARAAEEPALDILAAVERQLLALDARAEGVTSDLVSTRVSAVALFKHLEELHDRGGRRGLMVGLSMLDGLTSGALPGQLWVLGARPSMGKSALGLQYALAAARTVPVLFFSMEMGREELGVRALSVLSAVPQFVVTGVVRAKPQEEDRIGAAMEAYGDLDLHIDETPALTLARLRGKLRRFVLREKRNPGLVVIDYLQLMKGEKGARFENRNLEISTISAGLKQLAKEFACPVLVLSQLSRASEQRGAQKRPQLSDLRDSGAIEQDADVVLLLHRPAYYDTSQDATLAECIVAKQRNGPTGCAVLTWARELTCFQNRKEFN